MEISQYFLMPLTLITPPLFIFNNISLPNQLDLSIDLNFWTFVTNAGLQKKKQKKKAADFELFYF